MIPVEDLIGRGYFPGRCIGAVREVLRRKFPSFVDLELPDTQEEAERWLKNPDLHWREIGRTIHAAGRDGDVIYGEGDEGAYVVVVTDQVGRICLSANKEMGVHRRNLHSLKGVLSVQRRSG
jgi:hypothetical protein